jgi:hypothetical protein
MCYEHNISRWTLRRQWVDARKSLRRGELVDVINKMERVGRKARVFDMDIPKGILVEKRTTIRALASALETTPSYMYIMLK